jgi:hypothetical protein
MNTKLYDAATVAAVTLTPLAPAVFFGSAVYAAAIDFVPAPALAAAGAIATALGWELVGVLAGHVTLGLLRQANRLWLAGALILLAYAGLGAWALPGVLRIAFVASLLSYLVAGLRYVHGQGEIENQAIAAERKTERVEERQARREARERERERAHELQVLALSQHAAPTASIEPAPSQQNQHLCEDCGRTFGSVQAANAHRRFCAGAPAVLPAAERQNGHHLEEQP